MRVRTIEGPEPRREETGRRTAVFLADPDPIARYVLECALRHSGLAVTASAAGAEARECQVTQVHAAMLATDHRDNPRGSIREWTRRRVPVLLIGVGWTRQRIHAALSAGATGCLVKDSATERLGAAVRAVVSGHMVISPELMGLYGASGGSPEPPPGGGHAEAAVQGPGRVLTAREREVLAGLAQGLSTAEVADWLGVSPATVKSHVSHALTKLGARNRVEAILMTRKE